MSTAVGLAVALHLARLPERARTLLSFVIALPLTFSGLIVAYGFILGWGAPASSRNCSRWPARTPPSIGKALFTPVGLAFASSYYLIPRVVMSLLPVLVNFDRASSPPPNPSARRARRRSARCCCRRSPRRSPGPRLPVAAVVFGAYGTALALVGTQLRILPLQLYSLVSETGSDFPAAAALALLITAACSALMAAGECFASRHERHLAA